MDTDADEALDLTNRSAHLVCWVGGHRFALAVRDVVEVHHAVAITALPGAPETVIGAVDLRGRFVPVLDVRRRLGLAETPVRPSDVLVDVALREQSVLLRVDGALRVTHIDQERLQHADEVVPGARYLRSVTTIDDGPLVVHDIEAFLSATDITRLVEALQRVEAARTAGAS